WVSVLSINLGLATRKQGNYVLAELHLQEALLLDQQHSIPQITANALYEKGNLYLDRQQLEAAESAFREMLAITPENGQDLITLARYRIARTIAAKGDACEAQRLGEASVVTLEAIGHRYSKEARDWLN